MRRRLALLSLATTTLVVVSLLIPLGLLVRRQAADRARDAAGQEAQAMASLIALVTTFDARAESVAPAIEPLADGVVVVLPDGTVFGAPLQGQGGLVTQSEETQSTISSEVPGGWELALPVIGREGVAVVDVFVPDAVLHEGVVEAWALLAFLGVALVGVSVLLADRLGRRLVRPIEALATAAHSMAGGDLATRVSIDEPEEVKEVGEAFNSLSSRLADLLVEERESVADLSHRLRTPLTSLRLQAERLGDEQDRVALLAQIDRLEESIDQMIHDARRGGGQESGSSRLDDVVRERVAFWRILADEQERRLEVSLGSGREVALGPEAVETIVDILIGNVFSHTDPGVPFEVSTDANGPHSRLIVSDRGPGFLGTNAVARGHSGGGSTGLGLDIVRKSVESVGGELQIDDRPTGGAVITVTLADRSSS